MRFLVTAGNTREKIDDVRDWGNIFTGNTGFAIAQALTQVGEVDLLTSNPAHFSQVHADASPLFHAYEFRSHADLKKLLEERMKSCTYDAVFMSAAVADYRPVKTYAVMKQEPGEKPGEERWIVQDVQAGKVKSTHKKIAILGEPTEKIVDLFRTAWNFRGTLVKFKLEVGLSRDELIKVASASRIASGANYLVANTLDMVHGADAGAFLLSDKEPEWVPRARLAERMVELVRQK
ncbi:MAG TPA: phosphopantothenoylcysteine decarboxylase [Tepidisphaeraceae bacterium]|nr:phosphopantothenoylcysteine decarboxylase [Tepidisphaeraceae bacterium]